MGLTIYDVPYMYSRLFVNWRWNIDLWHSIRPLWWFYSSLLVDSYSVLPVSNYKKFIRQVDVRRRNDVGMATTMVVYRTFVHNCYTDITVHINQ
jgi:hypothetical protein